MRNAKSFAKWRMHKQVGTLFSKLFWSNANQNFVGFVFERVVCQRHFKTFGNQSNDCFAPTENFERSRHCRIQARRQNFGVSNQKPKCKRYDDVCNKCDLDFLLKQVFWRMRKSAGRICFCKSVFEVRWRGWRYSLREMTTRFEQWVGEMSLT